MNKLTSVTIISGVLIASMFGSVTALVITDHLKIDSLSSFLSAGSRTQQDINQKLQSQINILRGEAPLPVSTNHVIISKNAGSSNVDCIKNFSCFSPDTIMINKGDTVTWTNNDHAGHTVFSGKSSDDDAGSIFSSNGLIKPNQEFQYTFNKSGIYPYFCEVHPWLTGSVSVS